MGDWGYDSALGGHSKLSLEAVVAPLNPLAKQAFLAAASKGNIKRNTWNGCAFNAGGNEIGQSVSSTTSAAQAFGLPHEVVARFIRTWDRLTGTDEQATQRLIKAIETVGLSTEPHQFKTSGELKRWVKAKRVFTSEETRVREEFERLMAENKVEFAAEAEAMLCGASL